MKELNLLTQRLLAEGWTKESIPPGCRPWNEFYGGWTYDYKSRYGVVFETPCGLLLERKDVSHSGSMFYGGIEWMEENNNCTIICPYYDQTEPCQLNHPVLMEHATAGGHYENLVFCAVHETNEPFDYEKSVRRVVDLADAEMEERWKAFRDRHNGRVCRQQARYNRRTKEWTALYDPMVCARMNSCRFCSILNKELSPKKGNIFYDERRTYVEKGEGLFQDETRSFVVKGKKLLERTASITLCEAVLKYGLGGILRHFELETHFERFANPSLKIEYENFRAEIRANRDLISDLQDVKNGVQVFHATDLAVDKKNLKRSKAEAALKKKKEKMEREILEHGYDGIPDHRKRAAKKYLGQDRIIELIRKRHKKQEETQISLF